LARREIFRRRRVGRDDDAFGPSEIADFGRSVVGENAEPRKVSKKRRAMDKNAISPKRRRFTRATRETVSTLDTPVAPTPSPNCF